MINDTGGFAAHAAPVEAINKLLGELLFQLLRVLLLGLRSQWHRSSKAGGSSGDQQMAQHGRLNVGWLDVRGKNLQWNQRVVDELAAVGHQLFHLLHHPLHQRLLLAQLGFELFDLVVLALVFSVGLLFFCFEFFNAFFE